MNNLYWNNFYKKFYIKKNSNFSAFVLKKINKKKNLLEVGCGNGRDTFFFLKKKILCTAFDISITAIKKNKKIVKNVFYQKDVCKKNLKTKKKYDYIYARFFLHAINYKQEKFFFLNCKKLLKKKGLIFLEFRTIEDPLIQSGKFLSKYERISDHYRRFINVDDFQKRIKNIFKIMYLKQSRSFAIFQKSKPHICRIVLKYE
jgi:tellurite methyltransferase